MNFNTQILSQTYSNKLKELGITKDSFFKWEECGDGLYRLRWPDYLDRKFPEDSKLKFSYNAYTPEELLEILPEYFHVGKQTYEIKFLKDKIAYVETTKGGERNSVFGDDIFGENKADNYAKLLVLLIEQGFLFPNDL